MFMFMLQLRSHHSLVQLQDIPLFVVSEVTCGLYGDDVLEESQQVLEVILYAPAHHNTGNLDQRDLVWQRVKPHSLFVVRVHDYHRPGPMLLSVQHFDAKGTSTSSQNGHHRCIQCRSWSRIRAAAAPSAA